MQSFQSLCTAAMGSGSPGQLCRRFQPHGDDPAGSVRHRSCSDTVQEHSGDAGAAPTSIPAQTQRPWRGFLTQMIL